MSLPRDLTTGWPVVSELLDEALSLPASDLDTWLAALKGRHLACKEEPRNLLAAKALRGNLDAILAKALRKRPADRYPNVESLVGPERGHVRTCPVDT